MPEAKYRRSLPAAESWRKHRGCPRTARGGPRHDSHHTRTCPVDFSEISQHALDHAAAIAHWYQAQLTLLHVFVTRPTMDALPLVLEDPDRERLTKSIREMAVRVPPDVCVDVRVEQAEHVHNEILGSSRPRVLTCWCSVRMAARDFSGGSSAQSLKR
jgi:nucleotide-binding universal stress UspA family protein